MLHSPHWAGAQPAFSSQMEATDGAVTETGLSCRITDVTDRVYDRRSKEIRF
jgi:hypothetical protein